MDVKETAGNIGAALLGIGILIALLMLILLFFWGAAEVAEIVLPWLFIGSVIIVGIEIVLLVPLTAIPPTRQFGGTLLYIASFVTGITSWFLGLLLAWTLWGACAVVGGLLLMGIGVIPVGLLAALFNGLWIESGVLVGLVIVTLISRVVGASALGIDE